MTPASFALRNASDLEAFCRRFGSRLGPKSSPTRTKTRKELWTLAQLLKQAIRGGAMGLPLNVQKQERPDFRLEAGNEILGVEITEATEQEYHDWLDRIEESPNLEFFRPSGWHGDSPERMAAGLVVEAILKKNAKYQKHPPPDPVRPDICCYLNHIAPVHVAEFATVAGEQIRHFRRLNNLGAIGRIHVVDSNWLVFDLGNQDRPLGETFG